MNKYVMISILVLVFCECKQQDKKIQISKEMNIEKKHSEEEFRRFTFFVEFEDFDAVELVKAINWEGLSRNNKDIYESNIYQKETGFFIVFDTDSNYDSKKLISDLNVNKDFLKLVSELKIKNVHLKKYMKPLERIFKMEQKKMYSPEEGQLKTKLGKYKRFVWTLLLQEDPELMKEYKKVHSIGKAWPEITNNMKTIGIKDMELYLYGTRAVLIMDTKPDFDLKVVGPKWQKLPREKEWQEYVAKFQRTELGSEIQEKWLDMIKL